MYNFKDTKPAINELNNFSSLAITFDGNLIDGEIEGFRTLSVSGRELLGNSFNSVKVNNRDGEILEDVSLPSRRITVNYLLQADTNEEFRLKYNVLNGLLHNSDGVEKVFYFNDEPDYHFEGILESATEPNSDTNVALASFTLNCSKPFKYGQIETSTGKIPIKSVLGNNKEISYKIKLEEITFTTNSINQVILKNETTGERIILNDSFVSGNLVKITPKTITKNSQNIVNKLDYSVSIWKRFKIRAGDTLSVTWATNLSIKFRRCLL